MEYNTVNDLLDTYCYGPADLMKIRKGESTMWLSLRDSAGKKAIAVYRGCVYWRLEPGQTGLHLSLVQRLSADALLRRTGSVTLRSLEKNTDNVAQLLREWEAAGLSFYLHQGYLPGMEYLVVAKSLEYQELS